MEPEVYLFTPKEHLFTFYICLSERHEDFSAPERFLPGYIFSVDRQNSGRSDIRSTQEVGYVKRNGAPVVHCVYTKAEESLSRLLEEAFQLYLARILAPAGGNAVPWER